MKISRLGDFKTNNSEIWRKKILKFNGGGGLPFVATVGIKGLDLAVSKITVGPVVLRQFNEKVDANRDIGLRSCCILEVKFEEGCGSRRMPNSLLPTSYINTFDLIYSVYQSLLVMFDAWIGTTPTYFFNKNGKFKASIGSETEGLSKWIKIDGENIPVDLPNTKIKRLNKKILLKIINAQYGKCQLAIDRYSKACAEITYESMDESIIDFVIVLESLLGIGLSGEISHRISSRAAILLSPTKKERQNYYDAIRYLYDLRSAIVHGEIDEVRVPKGNKKEALEKLGLDLSSESWELRCEISDFARRISRKVLLFFINNEDKLNKKWLNNLELGMN